jgi:hypothetical protein
MKTEKGLICTNCGNEYFYLSYNLTIGSHENETQFELLKCLDCGQLRTETAETTR